MRREAVTFVANGTECAGYLYLPATAGPLPGVVLAHGFGGTMDRLTLHVERFAPAGFAALVFD